jgi:Zn-dependent peptidase ImmA (M78 family)
MTKKEKRKIRNIVKKVNILCHSNNISLLDMQKESKKINLFKSLIPLIDKKANLKEYNFKKWDIIKDGYAYIYKDKKKINIGIPKYYELVDSFEDSNRQQNFYLAHLIGHLILHMGNNELRLDEGAYTELQTSYVYLRTLEFEKEADIFAYYLLAPKNILKSLKKFLPTLGISDFNEMCICISHYLQIPTEEVEEAWKFYNL